VKISKVDATNSREIAGAQLVLYKVESDGSLTKLTSWTSSATEVFEFTLEAGDYAIEETIAPEGYSKKTSLVKFNLSFDDQGNPVTKVTEGPGTYDAENDKITFEDDPIKVTGKLSVHVVEEKTGRDVPNAKVEVEYPDGTKKTYVTNDKGEIVDENGNTPIDVPAGDYKVTVIEVPKGYEVTTGETGTVTVPENSEARHEAKIIPKTGGMKVQVLEEGTNRVVPGASVEIEAPEGKTFPDGSKKITVTTDSDGRVTTYTDKDGNVIDLTTGLEPGDYKVTVTKVPDGYKVTTGKTDTVTVKKGEVAEHVALIATSDTKEPTKETTPTTPTTTPSTPSTTPSTPATTSTPSTTPSTPATPSTNPGTPQKTAVNTGDTMNMVPIIVIMILSLIAVIVVIITKKRLNKKN
jgi:5-hydroxyisourate hydrolase-like protein (transthyretin family)